jgi:hypothetical protein
LLPGILKGRQVQTDDAIKLRALPEWLKKSTTVASKAGSPIWTIQKVGAHYNHIVALPIPNLNDGEPLFQHFHGGRFLQLLPLLLFLRTLTEDQCWEPPPLQACLMIDDPNLHWRTYGFVNFAQITAHAQEHNYHVSFATIPLDTWFIHTPTASLFRQHRNQLSLLIHGNDHVKLELARPYSDEEQDSVLRQALWRIAKFERRSKVEVSRVMAPPHGACSERILKDMARLGFEAASISKGSLRHYNGQASWLRTLGMKPSDIIGGLPVFPRFPFSGNSQNNILLAALLHQPIIPMGHHHDIADGLKLFADLSGFINSLGPVQWTSMKRISRSRYARRLDGKILHVKMFTKYIEICVPEGVRQLLIIRSWLQGAAPSPFAWRLLGDDLEWKPHHPDEPIPVLPGQKIEIISEPPTSSLNYAKNVRKFHIWSVVRRQLTEARDRISPLRRRSQLFR